MTISKRRIISYLLVLITLLVLDMFFLTPAGRPADLLLLLFSTIGHAVFFIRLKYFDKKIRTWYFVFLGLMIISMSVSYIHYGIGILSLLIANINLYHIGSASLFYYLFTRYAIQPFDYFKSLEKVGWLFFAFYVFMLVTGFGFVNVSELTGRTVILDIGKVPRGITTFIGLYWLSKFFYKPKYLYLLIGLLFLSVVHWGEIQRFHFVVTVIIILLAVYLNVSRGRTVKLGSLKLILFLLVTGGALAFFIDNDHIQSNIQRFEEASKIVALNEGQIEDFSVSVRVTEVLFAVEKFLEKPLFGHGLYRASDKEKVVGSTYFFVEDIGFIAFLFSFGIVGMVIFIAQLITFFKYLNRGHVNHFYLSILLTFSYSMMFAFLSGSSIYRAHYFLFLIAFLEITSNKNYRF